MAEQYYVEIDIEIIDEAQMGLIIEKYKGESGQMVVENVSGSAPEIVGQDNHRYICGEVATISIVPSQTGITDVVFESGAIPAVLELPSAVKVPDWFNPDDLKANAVYEINIMDGTYAVVAYW